MAERMNHADNFWFCMDEPTNLMIITAFMEFNEPLDFKRLYATIESRLASFPRFQKSVVRPRSGVGLPTWKTDPNYDLRSHLQRQALPDPGDKAELQKMIANLMISPLAPNRPLWQVHLIENYGKGCVLFFKIHHCIADGIALTHVLLSTADTDPDAPWPKSRGKKNTRVRSFDSPHLIHSTIRGIKETISFTQNLGRKLTKELEKAVSDPAHLKQLAKTSSRLPTDFASVLSKHTIMKSDPNTAFKGKLGVRKKVPWTEPMALIESKRSVRPSIPRRSTMCSSQQLPAPCVGI